MSVTEKQRTLDTTKQTACQEEPDKQVHDTKTDAAVFWTQVKWTKLITQPHTHQTSHLFLTSQSKEFYFLTTWLFEENISSFNTEVNQEEGSGLFVGQWSNTNTHEMFSVFKHNTCSLKPQSMMGKQTAGFMFTGSNVCRFNLYDNKWIKYHKNYFINLLIYN